MRINQSRSLNVHFPIELDKFVHTHKFDFANSKEQEIQHYLNEIKKCKDKQDYDFFARPLKKWGVQVPEFVEQEEKKTSLRVQLRTNRYFKAVEFHTQELAKELDEMKLTDAQIRYAYKKMIMHRSTLPCVQTVVYIMFYRALGLDFSKMRSSVGGQTAHINNDQLKECRAILRKFAEVNYEMIMKQADL